MRNARQEVVAHQHLVTVCVCTFRRASVAATLHSLVNQTVPKNSSYHIIIVDNDFSRTAELIVSTFRATTGMDVEYLHEPAQNISIARNAGLEACRTRWLAFIDDDETAAVDWLKRLIANRDGAVAVFGPCEAIYSKKTSQWIRIGDYHSNRIVPRHGIVDTGYTSNVLIDMDFVRVHGLRFDEVLGRTGGEDTMFFYDVHRCGGRLAYASDAVVYEEVPRSRATLAWIVTRQYRAGQTYAMLLQRYKGGSYHAIPLSSPIKVVFCLGMAAALAIRPARGMWWLMRGVFHYGALTYWFNGRVHEEYARSGRNEAMRAISYDS